jgi:hypothetical protein
MLGTEAVSSSGYHQKMAAKACCNVAIDISHNFVAGGRGGISYE